MISTDDEVRLEIDSTSPLPRWIRPPWRPLSLKLQAANDRVFMNNTARLAFLEQVRQDKVLDDRTDFVAVLLARGRDCLDLRDVVDGHHAT